MAAARKRRDTDIRLVFDRLSDDALLDDFQVGLLAGRAGMTIKRWRREGKTPPCVSLNGAPRFKEVGDIKPWLRGPTRLTRALTRAGSRWPHGIRR